MNVIHKQGDNWHVADAEYIGRICKARMNYLDQLKLFCVHIMGHYWEGYETEKY